MNDIAHNRRVWGNHAWEERGEHWSKSFGGSYAQWHFMLRPRLARYIPASSIVEIATGYGRWTRFLIDECDTFVGFDLMEKCAAHCSERFGDRKQCRFYATDGMSLPHVDDDSTDLVFSFDSLVHCDWPVVSAYLDETLRVLKPGAVALLHHSNGFGVEDFDEIEPKLRGWRSNDVSAQLVRDHVNSRGASIVSQELVDWLGRESIDCITCIAKRPQEHPPVVIDEPVFNQQMKITCQLHAAYDPIDSSD